MVDSSYICGLSGRVLTNEYERVVILLKYKNLHYDINQYISLPMVGSIDNSGFICCLDLNYATEINTYLLDKLKSEGKIKVHAKFKLSNIEDWVKAIELGLVSVNIDCPKVPSEKMQSYLNLSVIRLDSLNYTRNLMPEFFLKPKLKYKWVADMLEYSLGKVHVTPKEYIIDSLDKLKEYVDNKELWALEYSRDLNKKLKSLHLYHHYAWCESDMDINLGNRYFNNIRHFDRFISIELFNALEYIYTQTGDKFDYIIYMESILVQFIIILDCLDRVHHDKLYP